MQLIFVIVLPLTDAVQWHRYDTMVCPSVSRVKQEDSASKGFIRRGFDSFKSFFTSTDTDEATPIVTNEEVILITDVKNMRKTCLEVYLKNELHMISTGSIKSSDNLALLVQQIVFVYSSLLSPSVQDGDQKLSSNIIKKWNCYALLQVSTCIDSILSGVQKVKSKIIMRIFFLISHEKN